MKELQRNILEKTSPVKLADTIIKLQRELSKKSADIKKLQDENEALKSEVGFLEQRLESEKFKSWEKVNKL